MTSGMADYSREKVSWTAHKEKEKEETNTAFLLQRVDESRVHRGNVALADLSTVARDAKAHTNLDLAEHALELVLRRVLAEPSAQRERAGSGGRKERVEGRGRVETMRRTVS
jgi:hypothetical protein